MPQFISICLLYFFLQLLFVTDSLAQELPAQNELPSIIVSASRIQSVTDKLPGTTIIDREVIEKSGLQSVPALLNSLPGIYVIGDGAPGSPVSVSIRGAEPNYTLFLINGIPVNNPTDSRGGTFDLNSIDLLSIERIEITRGARSSVHGSTALAGTINIVTQQHTEQKTNTFLEGGTGDYRRGRVSLATGTEQRLQLSAFKVHSGAAHSDRGAYETGGIDTHFETSLDAADLLSGFLGYTDSSAAVFPDDSGGRFSAIERLENRDAAQWRGGVSYERELTDELSLRVHGGYYDLHETIDSPAIPPGQRDPFGIPENYLASSFERLNLAASIQWSLLDSFDVLVGAEAVSEDGVNTGYLLLPTGRVPTDFTLRREIYSGFLETAIALSKTTSLRSGLRLDAADTYSTATTPHLEIEHIINKQQSVSAGFYRGFKLPSFFALGNPIVGNVALAPEKSQTGQLEYRYQMSKNGSVASLTTYYSEFSDAIVFLPGPPPALSNATGFDTMGGEFTFQIQLTDSIKVIPWLAYTRLRTSETSSALYGRPKWRGGTTVYSTLGSRTTMFLRGQFTDSVADSSIPTGDQQLASYTTFDVGVQQVITTDLTFSLSLDNIFDRHYEQAIGVQADGLRIRLGLEWKPVT